MIVVAHQRSPRRVSTGAAGVLAAPLLLGVVRVRRDRDVSSPTSTDRRAAGQWPPGCGLRTSIRALTAVDVAVVTSFLIVSLVQVCAAQKKSVQHRKILCCTKKFCAAQKKFCAAQKKFCAAQKNSVLHKKILCCTDSSFRTGRRIRVALARATPESAAQR